MKSKPCNDKVYRLGRVACIADGESPAAIERWVRVVAALTFTRTDWHYAGGRAVVKTLGSHARVRFFARHLAWLFRVAVLA